MFKKNDVRYTIRTMAKNPGFTIVVVLMIAMGVGANTAIFSVIRGVLLRSLDYDQPDRLVALFETNKVGSTRESTSIENFLDWRSRQHAFEGITAYANWAPTLSGTDEPEQLNGNFVTSNFFSLLGARPLLGRVFVHEEGEPGHAHVVVVSYALWERRFGRDPGMIGKQIRLDNETLTVVGVLGPDYRNPDFIKRSQPVEIWQPYVLGANPRNRRMGFLRAIARLKPGLSMQQARAEMNLISGQLAEQYPQANAGFRIVTMSLKEALVGDVKRPLWLLFGAVATLLLIACANVANLLVARCIQRRKEFALRAALGEPKHRLIVQLVTESVLLSFIGGGLGLVFATWGLKALKLLAGSAIPRSDQVRLDGSVLLFTILVSFLTGLLFGLLPALSAGRADLNEALRAGGRTSSPALGSTRFRGLLAGSEIALTAILLVGAGLLLRSFWNVQKVELGFRPDRAVTASLRLPVGQSSSDPRNVAFLSELLERIRRLPGVDDAAAVNAVPLGERRTELRFRVKGQPEPASGELQDSLVNVVTSGYFHTVGVHLKEGRGFSDRDSTGQPEVAVISESLARRYFSPHSPIGARIDFGSGKWPSIVGVVEDVRDREITAAPKPQIYVPHAQQAWPSMTLVIRTHDDPLSIVPALRRQLWEMDKTRPLSNIRTLDQLLSDSVYQRRFAMLLLTLFAVFALVIASVGLYGVIAYSVGQRSREFGLWLALGAQRSSILALVLRNGVTVTASGLVIGLAGALVFSRLVSTLLYGVRPADPITFVATAGLLFGISLLASYIPARRATRVDPLVTLRED